MFAKLIAVLDIAVGALITLSFVLVALSALLAWPTMLLWDWLMPTLFGLKTITLFQAWGVNVFSGVLFRGGYQAMLGGK